MILVVTMILFLRNKSCLVEWSRVATHPLMNLEKLCKANINNKKPLLVIHAGPIRNKLHTVDPP